MPFDMFGWSPNTATGFGGRQTGDYFGGSYYNPDTGRLQGTPYVAPTNPTPPSPAARPYVQGQQFAPPAQMDFFSMLSGLVGGGAPQGLGSNAAPQMVGQIGPSGAFFPPQGGPQQYGRYVTTPGGQGRFGGVSKEGQRQMFLGQAQAYGNRQAGMYGGENLSFEGRPPNVRGNPLSNLPNNRSAGNGLFQRRGGVM